MQQIGASPLSINGRRAYLEIFISEPVLSISFRYLMLAPSSTEPSNQRADSRSGSLLTLEEISPWTSLKARELSLGPSDAPCLGEASTAHDDYFFSVKLIHLTRVTASQASAPAPDHTHMFCLMNLLIPELTPSPPSFSSDPASRRSLSDPFPNAGKLGFCLEGSVPNFGPLPIQRPRPIPNNPCLNNIKPRSVFFWFLSICSQKLGRSLHLNGRRHHVREESPSLLWSFNYTLRTLDLVLNLAIVNSLMLIQPSRTMVNYSRKHFGLLFRTPLLPVTEKNRTRSSSASQCIKPVICEANYPSSTSQDLLIVTISKIPEPFVEVSSTHRVLACGMLLVSLCFRVYMNLSLKFIAYLIFLMYAWKTLLQNFVSVASPLG